MCFQGIRVSGKYPPLHILKPFPTLVRSFELVKLIVTKRDFIFQKKNTEFSVKGPFSRINQIFSQVAKVKPGRGKQTNK